MTEETPVVEVPVVEAVPDVTPQSVEEALRTVIRKSIEVNGLVRGLSEVALEHNTVMCGGTKGACIENPEIEMHFLHSIPGVPHARSIADGLWLDGDQDILQQKLSSKEATADQVSVFMGVMSRPMSTLCGFIKGGVVILTSASASRDVPMHEGLRAILQETMSPGQPLTSYVSVSRCTLPDHDADSEKNTSDTADGSSVTGGTLHFSTVRSTWQRMFVTMGHPYTDMLLPVR